jgi:hypothetical protein
MNRRRLLWLAGGSLVSAAIPWLAHALRRGDPARCALEGAVIQPSYRVRLLLKDGRAPEFCCITCAQLWMEKSRSRPGQVTVTDEVNGFELDPSLAFFVLSSIITQPTTGNRIHVFGRRSDAEQHIESAGGRLLRKSELPSILR